MTGRLYLDFCGEEHVLEPGASLTFGRSGELAIDDNPYLHRLVGRFRGHEGVWWLDHLGSRSPMTVRDAIGSTSSTLGIGATLAMSHGEFVVEFSAGPTSYELLGALEEHEWATDLLGPDGMEGMATLDWGRVELNADQRLLLLAMCETRLRDPRALDAPLPTNRQGAARLRWSLPKFNRKLDHLCEKLHRAGVVGVHGGLGSTASDRRRRMVDHALTARLVEVDQLPLLDDDRAA